MDKPLIYIIVFVVVTGLIWIIDKVFDAPFNRLFGLVGLSAGTGPLKASATDQGEYVVLTLYNAGKDKLRLAAVEGRDNGNQPTFPVPQLESNTAAGERAQREQFAETVLAAGESITVSLAANELAELDCRKLAILDASGKSWPVEGFS